MTIPNAATANAGWKPNFCLDDLHHDRREKRTDVDAHVKNVVSAVLEVAAFGIEIADHRRDVRFEETVTDDQAVKRGINRPERRNREQSVTGHEEEAADHHGLAITRYPVGDQSADQRARSKRTSGSSNRGSSPRRRSSRILRSGRAR